MKMLAVVLSVDALARLFNLSAHEERRLSPARLPAVKLHGTLVAHDPRYSFALVDRRSVFIGDAIDDRTVTGIRRGCIVLDDAEELCVHPQPAPATASASPAGLHVALTDFAQWTQARVVPVPNGFRLFNVPPNPLGVQSGDIVRKLNGQKVDFSLLPLVHPGAHLQVELERNGQPFVLEGQVD